MRDETPRPGTRPTIRESPQVSRIPVPLLAACALYLVLRAIVIAFDFDAVAMPIYELSLEGNLAKLKSAGWGGVPLLRYYDDCGGQIVVGLLATPFYALFGDSFLVLKLVPLLMGLAALILIWRILDAHFDRRAAILAVFLFALVPPTLFKLSMLALGNHYEGLLLQLAVLACFFEAQRRAGNGWWQFGWAFVAGFALFFTLDAVLLVAILGCMQLLIRGPRQMLRDLPRLAAGLLLGLAPLFWVNIATGGRVIGFLFSKTGADLPFSFALVRERFFHLLFEQLPRAGVFEDLGPLPGRVADLLYLAVFLCAWAWLSLRLARGAARVFAGMRRGAPAQSEAERAKLLALAPLVLYFPLLVFTYAFSRLHLDEFAPPLVVLQFRYLLPHFLFATLVIAVAAGELLRGSRAQRAAGLSMSCAALATSLWMVPLVVPDAPQFGAGLRYGGFGLDYYSQLALREALLPVSADGRRVDREKIARELSDLPKGYVNEAWFGIGHRLGSLEVWPPAAGQDPQGFERGLGRLFDDLPEGHAIDVARGAGSWLRRRASQHAQSGDTLARLLGTRLGGQSPVVVDYLIEGCCLDFGQQLSSGTRRAMDLSQSLESLVPAQWRWALVRGRGVAAGRLLHRGIESDRIAALDWLSSLAEEQRADAWFGVGFGLVDGGADFLLDPLAVSLAPEPMQPFLALGAGAALRHVWGASEAAARASDIRARLAAPLQPHFDRGLAWSAYPQTLTW